MSSNEANPLNRYLLAIRLSQPSLSPKIMASLSNPNPSPIFSTTNTPPLTNVLLFCQFNSKSFNVWSKFHGFFIIPRLIPNPHPKNLSNSNKQKDGDRFPIGFHTNSSFFSGENEVMIPIAVCTRK